MALRSCAYWLPGPVRIRLLFRWRVVGGAEDESDRAVDVGVEFEVVVRNRCPAGRFVLPSAATTNVRRAQGGQMTPLAASKMLAAPSECDCAFLLAIGAPDSP